jgi:hypothetical protein
MGWTLRFYVAWTAVSLRVGTELTKNKGAFCDGYEHCGP